MNKYKIGKYIVKADSIHDAVTIVKAIKNSVKDGKYVSELKPGDVITKKDGSKWDVVLVRHTPFGIQVRMNSKTSPVKTEEITYRPTDMLAYDSVKDARRINYDDDIIEVTLNGKVVFRGYAEDWLDDNFDSNFKWTGSQYEASNTKGKWVVRVIDSFQKDSLTVRDVIQSLINEETSAISSYNVALETLKDHIPAEACAAIKAIRDDEQRHVENLYAVLNGNVTQKNLEDSVKDDTVMFPGSKLYKVAIKYGFLDNEKLAKKIAADSEWQAIINKYRDPLYSAPSSIDRIVKKYMK